MNSRLPCIVGVAQKTWHPEAGDAPHPLLQNAEVARRAIADCGKTDILGIVDELDVIRSLSWHYDDFPGELAAELGLSPGGRRLSGMSGTGPQRFLTDAAEKIMQGERRAVLVTGAEALATRKRAKRAGLLLDWPRANSKQEYPFEDPIHSSEISHEIFQAYTTFAILDSARRAHLGLTPDENRRQEAEMMARLSELAASNQLAWFRRTHTADDLYSVMENDRMVSSPFTKNTMAFMDVDMAAALLITSNELADELCIPEQKRIHLHGWGFAKALPYIAQRANLHDSPAMRFACDQAFARAGKTVRDIDFFDIYSCFASNVNFSLDVLGIAEDDHRRLTVTGGLPYFGGPGNNYTTHSIATMTECLRENRGTRGLVTAVGMHMTNHSFAIYGSDPQEIGAASQSSLVDDSRDIVAEGNGPAKIVGYTVMHARDGRYALAVCELESGARCYARCNEDEIVSAMEAEEWVGRTVRLQAEGGVNFIFVLANSRSGQ